MYGGGDERMTKGGILVKREKRVFDSSVEGALLLLLLLCLSSCITTQFFLGKGMSKQ